MAKRWAFKECKALNAIVEAKADSLYTKKGQPRKTVPEAFWEAVSKDMEQAGFKDRSASSVRKKFKSLGYEIQGSLNYNTGTAAASEPSEPDAEAINILDYVDIKGEWLGFSHVLFLDDLFSPKGVKVNFYGKKEPEEVVVRCQLVDKAESGRGLIRIFVDTPENAIVMYQKNIKREREKRERERRHAVAAKSAWSNLPGCSKAPF
jgi:hypothetical protein